MIDLSWLLAMISKTIREDSPILKREVNDEMLVYLNKYLATTQRPRPVVSRRKYPTHNNIHRGVHTLLEATDLYEAAR